jgi:hypothetical protein
MRCWPAWVVSVALPLTCGVAVYACARGGQPTVPGPEWLVSTWPDALWTFAMTAAVLLVWRDGAVRGRVAWALLALIVALAHEGAQLFRLVPGTFDARDVLAELGGWAGALVAGFHARTPRGMLA